MKDYSPDWKPLPPVKDAALLREAHAAYQVFGCSVCSTTSSEGAPSEFQIHVHHVQFRSRRGGDQWPNLVGLCGDALPGRCHARVHSKAIELDLKAGTWTDVEAMGVVTGKLRQLPARVEQSVEDRFHLIERLIGGAERDRLDACLLLAYAKQRGEWVELGLESWSAYTRDVGLTRAAVSKMLRVASTFLGSWKGLPRQDQSALSLERLYLAARLMDREGWTQEYALSEAVAHPPSELQARISGQEPDSRLHHCPDCGREHRILESKDG